MQPLNLLINELMLKRLDLNSFKSLFFKPLSARSIAACFLSKTVRDFKLMPKFEMELSLRPIILFLAFFAFSAVGLIQANSTRKRVKNSAV